MKTDIHQHLWTEPLVQALAQRTELPFVRDEHGLTVLFLAGERPYVIDLASEAPARRAALVRARRSRPQRCCACRARWGSSRCPARRRSRCSTPTTRARSRSASPSACGARSRSIDPDPDDVDRALDRGCVGVSLPAGALAGVDRLARVRPVLARLCAARRAAVRPPGARIGRRPEPARARSAIRSGGPRSRTTSPTCTRPGSRSSAPGGPSTPSCGCSSRCSPASRRCTASAWPRAAARHRSEPDPLVFYDTSSYGPLAIGALADAIGGPGQLLYGSDRPVVEPALLHEPGALDWELLADATARAFGAPSPGGVAQVHGRVSGGHGHVPKIQRRAPDRAAAVKPQASRSRGRRLSDENPPRLRTPPARPGPDRARAAGVRRRARRRSRSCGSDASTTTTPSASTRSCSPTST